MKILFLGDNRTRANWGCRGTSKALKDIIVDGNDVFYTIYGDITIRYDFDIVRSHEVLSLKEKICSFLYHRNFFRKWIKEYDPNNIIKESVESSYTAYKRMIKTHPPYYYRTIDEKLRECDALVCNGEGSFIFSNPPRYDSIFYALMLKLAQEYGKKTMLMNALFSDCPVTGHNNETIKECKKIFKKCSFVTARDPLSYNYYKEYLGDNVIYVPDALFTWTKFIGYKDIAQNYPYAGTLFPEYDKELSKMDFSEPYICLSGSSLAAKDQDRADIAYTKLALALKKYFRVIIVPTCDGDAFLKNVACNADCPIIPVKTNLFFGMSILCHACVFVSGRWHPSILASIGGTPCVFMGSNSHKTLSIQYMLQYPVKKEYSAIPNKDEIESIVEDCKRLSNSKSIRSDLIEKTKSLSIMSSKGHRITVN